MIIHKSLKITKLLSIVWVSLWLFGTEYTDALIDEPSPYLQQHAHNPVNWYPWGDEAFTKAKKEQKLISLYRLQYLSLVPCDGEGELYKECCSAAAQS